MRKFLSLLIALLPANLAAAPATMPTTRPAKVDLSSPDAAMQSYIDSVERGDAGASMQVAAPQTDDERRAMAQWLASRMAAQRLVDETRRRLGPQAAASVEEATGYFGLGPNKEGADSIRDAVRESTWKADGGDMVLEMSPELRFRQIDGHWRLLVPLEAKGEELEKRFQNGQEIIDWINQITHRVEAGELSDAEAIRKAVGRLLPVAIAEPASQPAGGEAKP